MKFFDQTNYPKIFAGSYWGQFPFIGEVDDTFSNRNVFAEEFNLKKYKRLPQYLYKFVGGHPYIGRPRYLDHLESYLDVDGNYIVVISPHYLRQEDRDKLDTFGYAPYSKLYHNMTETFVLKLLSRKNGTNELIESV